MILKKFSQIMKIKSLKVLTQNKFLTNVPILFAQIKAGYNSKKIRD